MNLSHREQRKRSFVQEYAHFPYPALSWYLYSLSTCFHRVFQLFPINNP